MSERIADILSWAFAGGLIGWALAIFICGWRSRRCDVHEFGARQDHVWDDDLKQWKPIYVRDVCTHCGKTVERVDKATG